MQKIDRQKILRILDANLNRLKEALRVCEDVCRFGWDERSAARRLKALRHQISDAVESLNYKNLVAARDIVHDVGKASSREEMSRRDLADIFLANSQRAKESIRVLEEISKPINRLAPKKFKKVRYTLYDVEKKIAKKL